MRCMVGAKERKGDIFLIHSYDSATQNHNGKLAFLSLIGKATQTSTVPYGRHSLVATEPWKCGQV